MKPNTRHPAQREALEARARTLREQGLGMAEIAAEVGVPASTLYQWAARGRWRLCDLAADAAAVVVPGGPEALANTPAGDAQDTAPDAPSPPPEEAARFLMAQASRYGVAGQTARAAATARLARQFLDLSVREAEAAALKAQADQASRRQLPPELVGVPLDAHCFPLEFPPGWTLKRARAEGRDDLVPVEVLREDLIQRLALREPARPQLHAPPASAESQPGPDPQAQTPRRRQAPHVGIRRL
ncbi:hypothetical protein [Maricaulis sp.]|uniref:hypothetical protein n=1 Tax=Maricaulis sp. TaxID=1486257 RepID=UPI003A954865